MAGCMSFRSMITRLHQIHRIHRIHPNHTQLEPDTALGMVLARDETQALVLAQDVLSASGDAP